MSDLDNGNGRIEVPIGDAKGNVLSLELAAQVLRLMHDEAPETLGYFVAKALTGTAPKAGRGRG